MCDRIRSIFISGAGKKIFRLDKKWHVQEKNPAKRGSSQFCVFGLGAAIASATFSCDGG
jgi:hypothetical protein